jgi:phosphoribosylformylglycinamidine cyclo-ligase
LSDRPALTYQSAGVDVAAGENFADKIASALRSTHGAHSSRILGDGSEFAGLFRLGEGLRDPILVSGTDGVGTKLKVAQRLGRHATIGIDLVAMCVNDVLTSGAAPLFFLDYIAAGTLDSEVLAAVVGGIADGCRQAGCVLLGGETAEMPDFYEPGVYDISGFAVGVAEGKKILGAAKVRAGDVLIGLPSSGLHSNGYSLVRRVFEDSAEWASESGFSKPGTTLGEILLEPTRIYAGAIAAIRENPAVHAVAHITGGGLPGNVARIMPPGSQAVLNPPSWQLPGIFREIEKRGPVERAEMFRTFNMGLGMVIAVSPEGADGALAALAEAGETPCRAGEVREGKGGGAVLIEGVDL